VPAIWIVPFFSTAPQDVCERQHYIRMRNGIDISRVLAGLLALELRRWYSRFDSRQQSREIAQNHIVGLFAFRAGYSAIG
jgi:hypothetical protein